MNKSWFYAAPLALLFGTPVFAGGLFPNFPSVGSAAYCGSYVNGSCVLTVPAGPNSLTGEELLPADTTLAGGVQPQTVTVPSGYFGYHVNRIIGGDFATNAWQRGTTPLSAASPTTTTMSADRWGVYSSANTVTVIKETAAADSIPTLGLNASMRVSRPSTTNTSQICTGQVLDVEQSAVFIGRNAVFSDWFLAGAGLNAVDAGNNLTMTIAYYTAGDSATPGTNTDAFMKGTIAGYTAAVGGTSPGTTGTVASGIATIPTTTTWTRYSVWAAIPTVNASGTAVTGVGVTICYTPASGTGGSTEWFEHEGAQLQALPGTATANLPNGLTSPTGFQVRPVADEQVLEYYYSWGLKEPAAGTLTTGDPVLCTTSGTALIGMPFPSTMRAIPTLTLTAGGWKIQTAVAQTAIGTTTVVSGTTAQQATLTSGAACTSTLPYQLVGTSTTGLFMFSAEP